MSVPNIVTQIDVAPGAFEGPLQRTLAEPQNRSQSESDYRKKLARSLNSTQRSAAQEREGPKPSPPAPEDTGSRDGVRESRDGVREPDRNEHPVDTTDRAPAPQSANAGEAVPVEQDANGDAAEIGFNQADQTGQHFEVPSFEPNQVAPFQLLDVVADISNVPLPDEKLLQAPANLQELFVNLTNTTGVETIGVETIGRVFEALPDELGVGEAPVPPTGLFQTLHALGVIEADLPPGLIVADGKTVNVGEKVRRVAGRRNCAAPF